MAGTQTAQRPYANWPKTALRVGFGVIWLIDAILKWLPGFRSDYMDTLMGLSGEEVRGRTWRRARARVRRR
jgi:hypothetical protein